MGAGTEKILDPEEAARIRRRGRAVTLRSAAFAALATALFVAVR